MEIITNLIFGCKRFGDWIQVQISKKFYFMIQTKDRICKLYSYFYGAPVILTLDDDKQYFFNYNVDITNKKNNKKQYKNTKIILKIN